MDAYLNLTFLCSWTNTHVIFVTFRTHFVAMVTIKIYIGCVSIVVTILMPLFCGGIMGNKIDLESKPCML
jgi:NADH:ubiquinone oxidoreductase subunit 6 (subunit J)